MFLSCVCMCVFYLEWQFSCEHALYLISGINDLKKLRQLRTGVIYNSYEITKIFFPMPIPDLSHRCIFSSSSWYHQTSSSTVIRSGLTYSNPSKSVWRICVNKFGGSGVSRGGSSVNCGSKFSRPRSSRTKGLYGWIAKSGKFLSRLRNFLTKLYQIQLFQTTCTVKTTKFVPT